MVKLKDGLPGFYAELEQALRQEGMSALLEQLPELQVVGRCGCDEDGCATFNVGPSRPLNVVEQNVIGVRHGDCHLVDSMRGMVVIDTDNFGRVSGVEVLGRPDVAEALDRLGIPKRAV